MRAKWLSRVMSRSRFPPARFVILPGAIEYSQAGAHSGGLNNNREFVESCVSMSPEIPPEIQALLYDPQTSGGLLISLPEESAAKYCKNLPAPISSGASQSGKRNRWR